MKWIPHILIIVLAIIGYAGYTGLRQQDAYRQGLYFGAEYTFCQGFLPVKSIQDYAVRHRLGTVGRRPDGTLACEEATRLACEVAHNCAP
jgi:hypothetical protein